MQSIGSKRLEKSSQIIYLVVRVPHIPPCQHKLLLFIPCSQPHLQLSRDGYGALEGDPPKPGSSRKRRADVVQHRGFQPGMGMGWKFQPGIPTIPEDFEDFEVY